MAGYVVCGDPNYIAIRAGSLSIQIVRIDIANSGLYYGNIDITRYDSSSLSGTSIAVVPLREGSLAASATARTASSLGGLAVSGTARLLGEINLVPGANSVTEGTTVWTHHSGTSSSTQAPLTLTVDPGGVLVLGAMSTNSSICASIFFQEVTMPGAL